MLVLLVLLVEVVVVLVVSDVTAPNLLVITEVEDAVAGERVSVSLGSTATVAFVVVSGFPKKP